MSTYGYGTGDKECKKGQTTDTEIEVVDIREYQWECLEPEIEYCVYGIEYEI